MHDNYSFFTDELALMEIRKHKWIESEKNNKEVGFATAAVDWVKKYGHQWKHARLKMATAQVTLSEQRKYRRFPVRLPVHISIDSAHFNCHTDNVNLVGLSCTIPDYIPNNTDTDVVIRFQKYNSPLPKTSFRFRSRITRVSQNDAETRLGFSVFLPFNEEVRDYLRKNAHTLNN